LKREKGLWLIDGGYLYKAQSSVSRDFHLDYLKLREQIESDGHIWRAYYLNSVPGNVTPDMESFFRWMQSAPPIGPKIVVRNYAMTRFPMDYGYCEQCGKNVTVKCPDCSSNEKLWKEQQKGVDVGLATLALTLSDQYDSLILSSGDSDLLDAVEYLCGRGKRLELVVFRTGVAPDLQCRADRIYWIDDMSKNVKRNRSGR